MNLFDAIFKQTSANHTAILYEQRKITYAELRDQTLAVARGLRALGVGRGDRVALMLNDSPEFIAAFIAVCSCGAIAVPINMALRLEEQFAILNDCTASVAIMEQDVVELLLSDRNIPNQLREIVIVDRGIGSARETKRKHRLQSAAITIRFLADLMDASKQSTPNFPAPEVNQPAFILYTSGSTGEPKGAVHRQADIFYTNETYCREVLQLRDGDRLFSSSRLPFAYGLGNAFTFPLFNGCTTILCRAKPTPEVVAKVFADYKPTIFFGVPVVYRLLLDEFKKHSGASTLDCSELRLCVSAGEALPAQLSQEWEQTFGVPVLDGIGSTEMLHMWMSNHEGDVVHGSSGKLLKGYEARLLDPEGEPTPPGAAGNLWVKGGSAAIGYWQRPETTANTFIDGWVCTGDLYRQDADGYWFHMGRSDDCFKSSGQWVSPVEVEGVLLRDQEVNRVAVVEDFNDDRLPCACAFIVRSNAAPDNAELEERLRKLARTSLPRFKQPHRYVFIEELPYTATGKVQRFKLRDQLRLAAVETDQPFARRIN
ncbi:MAG TPA: benzoate-CoA ligase family protein [Pyrinomonadaceae bacterium]|jgi:benzoate-CoA ligase|nr:benzoate-CoA ligase family protein [Pyrinomonadaceae bacterium]